MKKVFFIIFILLFVNLGNFLDISSPPHKSDIIIVLGGGKDVRIKKGVELYKNKYSKSNKFLYSGANLHHDSSMYFLRSEFLLKSGVDSKNIIHIENVTNTMEELLQIKKYLIKNNLKKILIVSHPTHFRRIQILAKVIANYDDSGINLSFVSADHTKVWNKNVYFLENESVKLVFLETIKIFYNLFKYTILLKFS